MVLKEAKELVWYWDSKPVKLKKLNPRQLTSIKKLLLKSNKEWFGKNTEYWIKAIKTMEKPINKRNTNQAINLILDNRIKNATLKANYITNTIVKCINKNNEEG